MNTKQTIKIILGHLKSSIGIKKYYFIFVVGFIVSILSILEPFLFLNIIQFVEDFYKTGVFELQNFIQFFLLWGGYVIFFLIISYFYRYYLVDVSAIKYYKYVFEKYTKTAILMNYDTFLSNKSGELYSQLNKGIRESFHFVLFIFLDIIRSLSGVVMIIIILLFIDIRMTLVTVSMVPVILFMGIYFNNKTAARQRNINEFDDKNYGIIADSMTNTSLVKNLGLEVYILQRIYNNIFKSYNNQLEVSKAWSILDIYIGLVVTVARGLTVAYGVYLISLGELSLSLLFLYFSLIGWIYFPLGFIFAKLRNVQEQLTSITKFFNTYDSLEIESDLEKGIDIKKSEGNIEFKNVEFGYNNSRKILQNINLQIKLGERIALVGNTGAGKSTIINLLFRFWDISSGQIILDGNDITTISKKSLRNQLGLVAQDNSLFNLSIKENLLFAKQDATDKELSEALKNAQANFVFDLENGIDTVIGERGLKLSGGEKQRISIARLFLKDPSILVLDEATSALDNKTEKLIQKALEKLMKGKTTIIVAHRLSTIQNVDTIYMLEAGEIVEQGNYEELIKKGGKFAELANPEHLILN